MSELQVIIAVVLVLSLTAAYLIHNPERRHHPLIAKVTPIDPDFKWQEQQPLPIRPFVGKRNFNPKIGVKDISNTPSDWLLIENTYHKVTTLKAQSLKVNPKQTMHIFEDSKSTKALQELYEVIFDFYLQRFPQYFVLDPKTRMIENKINGLRFSKDASKLPSYEILLNIGSNMEEDFVLLLKDDPNDKEQEYILRSSIVGFPAGFDPSILFNKPISYIHDLVPQYKPRLHSPMHKFFNNLKQTDLWVRHNWSIQTHGDYFTLANHARKGEVIKKLSVEDIDFANGCFLRCERQVLTRIALTGAVVMTVRTYLTSLEKIKNEENLGKELIRGIDLLPSDVSYYKKRESWGDAVKEYLSTKEKDIGIEK
ncbi:hypothetical protein CANMA_001200 [Candida margitis]|uniref:uncharacterized protein n=1 Tax=Candida margitis TaxID=1775924 RepID=UPI00222792D2|nr:uncharacterized protein CANMA_001200 [Candida margitis]KAI5969738.1 hypothetical protein CANMA_001200 [Candida margitis]